MRRNTRNKVVLALCLASTISLSGCSSVIDELTSIINPTQETETTPAEASNEPAVPTLNTDINVPTIDITELYNDSPIDSDGDGLYNSEEESLGTNPNKADSDDDGINDLDELVSGLDPLNPKSDGTTLDGERTFTKEYAVDDELSLNLEGYANVNTAYASKLEICKMNRRPGVVSELYEFYMPNQNFSNATITYKYDEKDLKEQGYDIENLSFFQYTNDAQFVEVPTVLDTEGKTLTASLQHFSNYCVADKTVVNSELARKVALVLDDSGSMYSKEVVSSSPENDVDFKRIDMAKNLVSNQTEDTLFTLATFTASYKELLDTWQTKEESDILNKIESIRTEDTSSKNFNGTDANYALSKMLNNFDAKDNRTLKTIFLLSDGVNTSPSGLWGLLFANPTITVDEVINKANERNVNIIAIGLGHETDQEYLNRLTSETGGSYFYASNADNLENFEDYFNSVTNNNYLDTDGDGIYDSILIADNGFSLENNVFANKNYVAKNTTGNVSFGQCAGMALFVEEYYAGKLPIKGDAVDRHLATGIGLFWDDASYLSAGPYDLSTVPFFEDADGDGYVDNDKNLADYTLLKRCDEVKQRMMDEGTYYIYEDGKIKINPEFFEEIGWSFVKPYERVGKGTYNGQEYTSAEFFMIDLNITEEEFNALPDEGKEFFTVANAVNNLYCQQETDEVVPIPLKYESGFQQMLDYLEQGYCPVLSGGAHAVNVYKVTRDLEDPHKYLLYIYDNNRPGEEITIEANASSTLIGGPRWDIGDVFIENAESREEDVRYTFYDPDERFGENNREGKTISFEIVVPKSLYIEPKNSEEQNNSDETGSNTETSTPSETNSDSD